MVCEGVQQAQVLVEDFGQEAAMLRVITKELVQEIVEGYGHLLEDLNLSGHELVVVEHLEPLRNLRSLDLSRNKLVDIENLRSLTFLEELDLSDNELQSVEHVATVLRHLGRLKTLSLKGNALCAVDGYQHVLFSAVPSLEVLDGEARVDTSMMMRAQATMPEASGGGRPTSSPATVTDVTPRQVRHSGAHTVKPASQYCLPWHTDTGSSPGFRELPLVSSEADVSERPSRIHQHPKLVEPMDEVTMLRAKVALLEEEVQARRAVLEMQEGMIASAAATSHNSQEVDHEKYLRLLRRWREEVFRLMVQAGRRQLDRDAEVYRARAQADNASCELKAERHRSEVLTQKLRALEAQVGLLERDGTGLKAALQRSEGRCQALEHELQNAKDALRSVVAAVVDFKLGVEEARRDCEAGLMAAVSQLEEYEGRISLMQGRVQLLGAMMAQKELQVRNTLAALDADRRARAMDFHRFSARQDCSHPEQQQPRHVVQLTEDSSRMPVIGLRPECEAMMRAVFRRLDSNGRGMVDARRLVVALERDGSVAKLMGRWVGLRAWSQALKCIQAKLADLSCDAPMVTWGEFLLFFIPDPEERDGEGGRARTIGHLYANPAEIDDEALLCLVVPETWSHTSVQLKDDFFSPEQLRKELRRLVRERAYLMQLVKRNAEDMLSRSERVRLRYVDEISRLQARVDELSSEVNSVRQALSDNRGELEQQLKRTEEIESRAEARSAKLVREVESRARAENEQLALEVRREMERCTRLQAELGNLKREHGKLMVSQGTIERDLARAKETLTAAECNKASLLSEHEERVQELQAAVSELRKERNAALVAARETQRGVSVFSEPRRDPEDDFGDGRVEHAVGRVATSELALLFSAQSPSASESPCAKSPVNLDAGDDSPGPAGRAVQRLDELAALAQSLLQDGSDEDR